MKLHLNNSGAWKQVLAFEVKDLPEVQHLAARMGLIGAEAGSKLNWRLLDDYDQVAEYWDDKRGWWAPHKPSNEGHS